MTPLDEMPAVDERDDPIRRSDKTDSVLPKKLGPAATEQEEAPKMRLFADNDPPEKQVEQVDREPPVRKKEDELILAPTNRWLPTESEPPDWMLPCTDNLLPTTPCDTTETLPLITESEPD